jgi:ATP-dependent NAD(P)H-hydrate dehydratase
MCHIICEKSASIPIKSYSPNLMVHPYLYDSNNKPWHVPISDVVTKVEGLLSRIHVVVVGPGLGRDRVLLETASKIIESVRSQKKPLVIDADGLYLIQHNLDLIRGYSECVLTPNVVEFERLAKAAGMDKPDSTETEPEGRNKRVAELAKRLGGVIILSKGQVDVISNGEITLHNDLIGSRKRVSGQGDTLSGALGTFLAWHLAYQNDLWKHDHEFSTQESKLLGVFGGSAVTRQAAHGAFNDQGRAMTTVDVTKHVGFAFKTLYGNPVED